MGTARSGPKNKYRNKNKEEHFILDLKKIGSWVKQGLGKKCLNENLQGVEIKSKT